MTLWSTPDIGIFNLKNAKTHKQTQNLITTVSHIFLIQIIPKLKNYVVLSKTRGAR